MEQFPPGTEKEVLAKLYPEESAEDKAKSENKEEDSE